MKSQWKKNPYVVREVSVDNMICILKEIINGQTPFGYVRYRGSDNKYTVKEHFTFIEKIKYVGSIYTIYVWEVKNNSIFKRSLQEKDLNFKGTNWVHLGKSCFKSQEKTIAITSIQNYE